MPTLKTRDKKGLQSLPSAKRKRAEKTMDELEKAREEACRIYVKHRVDLESAHAGEFVCIDLDDAQMIVDSDPDRLQIRSRNEFKGHRSFTLRIGG